MNPLIQNSANAGMSLIIWMATSGDMAVTL